LKPRHFLTGDELSRDRLEALLDRASELKRERVARLGHGNLAGKSAALIFERPSTRTRISFEVAAAELGATPVVLREEEMQLARGESAKDTALVLSRYLHAIVIRSGSHAHVAELAEYSEVPVINALTPEHHPCQALADLLTLRERFGRLEGLRVAYVGDGNNVARSLAILGGTAGVEVVVAAPEGYQLEDGMAAELTDDPAEAASGANAIYTDVWVSMGDEPEADARRADLASFQVNAELLSKAAPEAVVLHCLPAHPGEEITEDVLYGERSAVWDQAENRLHAQKALLEWLTLEASFKDGYALWEQGDVDGMVRFLHPEVEFQPAPELAGAPQQPLYGREETRRYWSGILEDAAVAFDADDLELRCGGDLIHVTGRMRITGAGSGASADARFHHKWRIRDGLNCWLEAHVETAMPVDTTDG
jgi:ornithine carbamoyltransferase